MAKITTNLSRNVTYKKAMKTGAASRRAAKAKSDVFGLCPDVTRAMAELSSVGLVAGARSARISARVDPGILAAAAENLGLSHDDISAVVNASLALAAAPDRFKVWLRDPGPALSEDFELAV